MGLLVLNFGFFNRHNDKNLWNWIHNIWISDQASSKTNMIILHNKANITFNKKAMTEMNLIKM